MTAGVEDIVQISWASPMVKPTRFHRMTWCIRSGREMPVSEAVARGYKPCLKCKPAESDNQKVQS